MQLRVGPQRVQQPRHVPGQRGRPANGLAAGRVCQCQTHRMQSLTPKAGQLFLQFTARARRQPQAPPVDRVAHDRDMLVRQVHPYLVSAPGFQLHPHQGVCAEAFLDPVVRQRLLAARHHGHALAIDRMPADGRIDTATRSQHRLHDGQVFPLYQAGLQCIDQGLVRRQVARHDQQSAGRLVQPVHNPRPGQTGQSRVVVQQRIQQRPRRIAGRRVHHQAGRLVYDQQIGVRVDQLQRDSLGDTVRLRLDRGIDADGFAAVEPLAHLRDALVQADLPGTYPLLQATAGILPHQLRQGMVKTAAAHRVGNGQPESNGLRHIAVIFGLYFHGRPGGPCNPTDFDTKTKPMRLSSFLLLLLLLFVGGCSLLPEQVDETKDWSASQLYSEAKDKLNDQNYEKAIEYFEKLEARYPFGRYAQQAQLEIAYAYYKFDEPDLAIAAADRFIKIYPRHENVDYAWYLKGLVNYYRGKTITDKLLPQDPSERDTVTMRAAYDDFDQLVQRFPSSIYAADAAQRMIYLRNNMAEYENHVADFYMRRKAYVAAANRGEYVVENFQRTPAVEPALVIMARAYRALDMRDLETDTIRVLRLNYPDSPEIALLEDPGGYERARRRRSSFWKFW
jgi:outer membrane protein assembly factor BamD